MLLYNIINKLEETVAASASSTSASSSYLVSYFFCQATDSCINSATAVLRGLIYLLANRQRDLLKHVQKKYDDAEKELFVDTNAWFALSEIFTNILQDPGLDSAYLIIDTLDECVVDLPKLLHFIAQTSSRCPHVKWIISSRNWPSIEKDLEEATEKIRLCLELNGNSISAAVATFIQFKVDWLAHRNKYDCNTRDAIQQYLSINADGTFLWVALVCQELSNTPGWKAQRKLTAFPPGLDALYRRMIDQIWDSDDAELCTRILATVSAVYRPLMLDELASVVEMPDGVAGEYEPLSEIIGLCGSFLALRGHTISFVHQSAKDFLVEKAYNEIFPSGIEHVHHTIFSRSLQAMSEKLARDIYGLVAPGLPIDQVKKPDPDPLSATRYSCVYWIDHLLNCNSSSNAEDNFKDGEAIDGFLRRYYLYWLEALSLCRSMSEGVVSMAKLEALLQDTAETSGLLKLVKDARRFIMATKPAIESSPLQAYASALLFSPTGSLIRSLFRHEEPKWIAKQPVVPTDWSACLQTLEGHSGTVNSVAFSHDSKLLASASDDNTVKVWDAATGALQQTLEGHSGTVNSVAFSHDSKLLASASDDNTVKVWDAATGALQQTLEGHSGTVNSVAFSHDSKLLASASDDNTVKVWDAATGALQQTLEGHSGTVNSVAFSHDSKLLASASDDNTVKVWDAATGALQQTLEGHSEWVRSVAFSHDSKLLASASFDNTAKVWDAATGALQQTLEGHSEWVRSVAFSHDSKLLASASDDNTAKVWDAATGALQQTLEGHSEWVNSVAFSHDSKLLASASDDNTVKVWDAATGALQQTLEGHSEYVNSVAFSHDSKLLASASNDNTVKIWDAATGALQQTLEGHSGTVNSVAFSHDSKLLASASDDNTVKVWDAATGALQQTLEGHSGTVNSVAFSHDSKLLASASFDNTVKVWDAATGALQQTLEGHSEWVNSVAFSHDSKLLASASDDNTVKVWDAAIGALQQTLEGHSEWVRSVAFSHNSKLLASASFNNTVKVWDAATGALQQTLPVDDNVGSLSFDVTNSILITDIGHLKLDETTNLPLPTSSRGLSSKSHRKGLGVSGSWVLWNGQNLLWLPPDFRARTSVISYTGSTVAIGCQSGKVFIIGINILRSNIL